MMRDLITIIFSVIVGVILFTVFIASVQFILHNTDSRNWDSRNARLYIDLETSCQYIENNRGCPTPRFDINGSHMGCKK